jgi:hypothetical protein
MIAVMGWCEQGNSDADDMRQLRLRLSQDMLTPECSRRTRNNYSEEASGPISPVYGVPIPMEKQAG